MSPRIRGTTRTFTATPHRAAAKISTSARQARPATAAVMRSATDNLLQIHLLLQLRLYPLSMKFEARFSVGMKRVPQATPITLTDNERQKLEQLAGSRKAEARRRTRQRAGKLSCSEMLFIVVLFHLSPFKHFKTFYLYGIRYQHRACFGDLPHYDRFVSLMPRLFVPLMILLHSLSGDPTGLHVADATKLAVCHNRRIHRHKVFVGLASRVKPSMGWFFRLKLHFVINHKGQVMALRITPGNKADGTVLDDITRH